MTKNTCRVTVWKSDFEHFPYLKKSINIMIALGVESIIKVADNFFALEQEEGISLYDYNWKYLGY